MILDWQLIKEKYPKSFEKFIKRYNIFVYEENNKIIDMQKKNIGYERICYCDLEEFFDSHDIIIEIAYMQRYKWWIFRIYYGERWHAEDKKNNRQEAKEQAIYNAFEILQIKLDKS